MDLNRFATLLLGLVPFGPKKMETKGRTSCHVHFMLALLLVQLFFLKLYRTLSPPAKQSPGQGRQPAATFSLGQWPTRTAAAPAGPASRPGGGACSRAVVSWSSAVFGSCSPGAGMYGESFILEGGVRTLFLGRFSKWRIFYPVCSAVKCKHLPCFSLSRMFHIF